MQLICSQHVCMDSALIFKKFNWIFDILAGPNFFFNSIMWEANSEIILFTTTVSPEENVLKYIEK